jgi:2,3-bisphosphoglycerate-dependent phosphoglycerate mutase
MNRTSALLLALVVTFPLLANGAGATTTVILVRHAEKVTEGSPADPALTDAGRSRAAELVHVLRDAGIDAIYTTPFVRTRTTAAPLAETLKLQAVETKAGAEEMVARIRREHAGETVLVVGHSNSTPALARAFGIEAVPDIADAWEFDNLFVITFRGDEPPHFVRLRYGAASMAP